MVDLVDKDAAEGTARRATLRERAACFHCGQPCNDSGLDKGEKAFCCYGCLTVHDLLTTNGLGHFYALSDHPGIRVRNPVRQGKWDFLDEPIITRQLVDFSNEKLTRVTFQIPGIHCLACVWLLENLFQLHPGIGRCQVNFPAREVAISFETGKIRIGELVALLSSIGYEPHLTLGELDKKSGPDPARKRQWLQVGIAGFGFGNIMLFSLPLYLGLDSFSGPTFKGFFGWLSLGISLPVLIYSAADYWQAAVVAIRRRMLTLDVPIALGLLVIYSQSLFEITTGSGVGYCDSLTGLIFFLLCGKLFQRATFARMTFDRDYKCFFPLSVTRKNECGEETISLSNVRVGDHLLLRCGELVPADAKLVNGQGWLDYSFVTGESEPVARRKGDHLYAGGKQIASSIEIEIMKPVSQSYLISLWDHEAFQKKHGDDLDTMTNRYSRIFTRIVLGVAAAALGFWALAGQPWRAIKAFNSVLIVACPCALALAAPFALGTAQRLLARLRIFLKNPLVIERIAKVNAVVFDKTGTLTTRASKVKFCGIGPKLNSQEEAWVFSLAKQSTHPHANSIASWLGSSIVSTEPAEYVELQGQGIEATIRGHKILLGARAWLERKGIVVPEQILPPGSASYLSIDRKCRGAFVLKAAFRPEIQQLLSHLRKHYEIALLSGDNEREREIFESLLGEKASLRFNQSPLDKLEYIRGLQSSGWTVMMVGDGLNDAGALKQSDVGVAVIEETGAFSPASDVIVEAIGVARLPEILTLSRRTSRIVRLSFGISAAYNVLGISIAAAGLLSPIVCAILMPLSSASVVLFACGATKWAAKRSPKPETRNSKSEIIEKEEEGSRLEIPDFATDASAISTLCR